MKHTLLNEIVDTLSRKFSRKPHKNFYFLKGLPSNHFELSLKQKILR